MNSDCPATLRSTLRSIASSIPSPLYAVPPNLARPLRVVLVTPARIPVWLSRFLQLAAGTSWLAVSVLPVTGATLPVAKRPPLDLRLFFAFDRRRKGASAALRPVPLRTRDCLMLASTIDADATPAELRSRMGELQPGLVLSLGPRAWTEVMAECAPLGCWDIDASLVDSEYAGTALLAPLVKGDPVTRLALELEGATLSPWGQACSFGPTRFGSFGAQRDTAFRKLPLLLLRMLHRLAADEFVPPNRPTRLRLSADGPPPGVGASARAFAITVGNAVLWQLRKGRPAPLWHLVLRQSRPPIDPAAPELRPDAVVEAAQADFWADPCVVEADGRPLVFVEEMWPDEKGIIACVELRDGTARRLGTALEESAHLSYPQVFAHDGEWYMTVESSQLKRVSLYRAARFPLGWERVVDLVSGRVCCDPTLHFHEGRWYLFATVSENGNGTWSELFLFVSDALEGPFRPHPANPIVSDVRRARPAGRLFVRDGRLIRPAQDCAANYGAAVVFNEVLALSPTHYDERPLSRLAPDWAPGLVACHTYSASDTLEVFDARGRPDARTPRLEVVEPAERAIAGGGTGRRPVVAAPAGDVPAMRSRATSSGRRLDGFPPRPDLPSR